MTGLLAQPLTVQLAVLLSALYGKCRGVVCMRSASDGYWHRPEEFSPASPFLLRELSYGLSTGRPPEITAQLASSDRAYPHTLLDVPALWAEIGAAAAAPLERFPRPSFRIDHGGQMLVAWLLEQPVAVDVPDGLGRVEALQQALAERLGGRLDDVRQIRRMGVVDHGGVPPESIVPAWHPERLVLRIPGSHSLVEGRRPVILRSADLDRRYTLSAIEDALALATEGTPR